MAVINSVKHVMPHLQALKGSSQAYLIPDERVSSPVGYCSQHAGHKQKACNGICRHLDSFVANDNFGIL
jgi:hypothetical protein